MSIYFLTTHKPLNFFWGGCLPRIISGEQNTPTHPSHFCSRWFWWDMDSCPWVRLLQASAAARLCDTTCASFQWLGWHLSSGGIESYCWWKKSHDHHPGTLFRFLLNFGLFSGANWLVSFQPCLGLPSLRFFVCTVHPNRRANHPFTTASTEVTGIAGSFWLSCWSDMGRAKAQRFFWTFREGTVLPRYVSLPV